MDSADIALIAAILHVFFDPGNAGASSEAPPLAWQMASAVGGPVPARPVSDWTDVIGSPVPITSAAKRASLGVSQTLEERPWQRRAVVIGSAAIHSRPASNTVRNTRCCTTCRQDTAWNADRAAASTHGTSSRAPGSGPGPQPRLVLRRGHNNNGTFSVYRGGGGVLTEPLPSDTVAVPRCAAEVDGMAA